MPSITDRQKKLLNMLSKHEAGTYDTIYGGRKVPELIQKTLTQVAEYQNVNMKGWASTAVGKYQFIKDTLQDSIRAARLPQSAVFSPDTQDLLIIARLKSLRKLNDWETGKLSDEEFMRHLSMEFASIPVPFDIPANKYGRNAPKRNLTKGQTFYAGDGLNKSHWDVRTFLEGLSSIKAGGEGAVTNVPIQEGADPGGTSPRAQMETYAGGGNRTRGRVGCSGPLKSLPTPIDVFKYEVIDPLDDRYDFRTGKKVKDLLENGTAPLAASGPAASGGSGSSGDGAGGSSFPVNTTEGAPVPTSDTPEKDFWTLVAICLKEAGASNAPQQQCDVAQSIYNRVISRAYNQTTIAGIILDPSYGGQYEPVKVGRSNWLAINSAETAARAAGRSVAQIKEVARNLKNASLQQAARTFVGSRTDFLGGGQPMNNAFNNRSIVCRDPRGVSADANTRKQATQNKFGFSYNYKGARGVAPVPDLVKNFNIG